jgi:hypothetical protein
MNTKKLAAAAVTAALVTLVPLTMLNTATVVAQQHATRPIVGASVAHKGAPAAYQCSNAPTGQQRSDPAPTKAAEGAPNAWSSRQSGLPQGGALLYRAPATAAPGAPNAWSSRQSGLPQGGAALYS